MRPKVMPANPMVAGGQNDALSMSSAALVRTYHLHGTCLPTVVSGGLNFHGVTIRARVGPADAQDRHRAYAWASLNC